MSLLIINASSSNKAEVANAIAALAACTPEYLVLDASELQIHSCLGCCNCMLSTPGVCCIQDDCEIILKELLHYDQMVLIADTALGFINYKAKNLIDRMFPMVNVLTHYHDDQILHIPRYEHPLQVGLIFNGDGDLELLNAWIDRFGKNMAVQPFGVFPLQNVSEVIECIS